MYSSVKEKLKLSLFWSHAVAVAYLMIIHQIIIETVKYQPKEPTRGTKEGVRKVANPLESIICETLSLTKDTFLSGSKWCTDHSLCLPKSPAAILD